ncbi:YIP1 family protein [Sporosarcina sp. D27]|uniref:YIP1 family protein n=1 Tax=Sporosarcina sp. D27 TaxID=1382305 RepID=UPI00046EDBED|nr:YIP1 family protein [Sporosarcina sp. D27]
MNLKPLLTIWSRPTATLQYLKNETTIGYAILIFAIAALASGGYQAGTSGLFSALPLGALIPLFILLTFVGALISWVIGAALYQWIGKGLFGGTGTFSEMLHVAPGATLPSIWLAPVNYLVILGYGKLAFEAPPAETFAITNLPMGVYLISMFLTFALGIYSIVISCKGIGIVHGFSAWRGLGVLLVVFVIGLIAAIVISLTIGIMIISIFSL